MTAIGYTLMTEQSGPKSLIRYAQRAESVGFDFAVCSDHYFPWLDEMGHSPNAWVTLGAVAQATEPCPDDLRDRPTFRYHPAVVAQQAATLQIVSDDRFTLGPRFRRGPQRAHPRDRAGPAEHQTGVLVEAVAHH